MMQLDKASPEYFEQHTALCERVARIIDSWAAPDGGVYVVLAAAEIADLLMSERTTMQ